MSEDGDQIDRIEDVGQELAEHPRFTWREGMRDRRGVRVVDLELWEADGALPDLTDAATGGVLLGILAELGALTDVVRDGGEWIVAVEIDEDGPQGYAAEHLAEAAAYALLAAWEVLAAPAGSG